MLKKPLSLCRASTNSIQPFQFCPLLGHNEVNCFYYPALSSKPLRTSNLKFRQCESPDSNSSSRTIIRRGLMCTGRKVLLAHASPHPTETTHFLHKPHPMCICLVLKQLQEGRCLPRHAWQLFMILIRIIACQNWWRSACPMQRGVLRENAPNGVRLLD